MPQRVTNEEIIEAYKATGSVWKAAKRLGLVGQSVHERLVAMGYPRSNPQWTTEEDEELRRLIEQGIRLAEVGYRLNRTYSAVAMRASKFGIKSNQGRPKKIPRGEGWDKVSVKKHLKAIQQFDGPVTRYCRQNSLNIETMVRAIQRHFPDEWHAYTLAHSELPLRKCDYCGEEYVPVNKRQLCCSRQCSDRRRIDNAYFGGNRRSTIGLAEGVCQICERKVAKGLSSHHMLGKENDPDNTSLIALCQGCHEILTKLAARTTLINDPRKVEQLLVLCWIRNHGAELAASPDPRGVSISVDIDPLDADDYADEMDDDAA